MAMVNKQLPRTCTLLRVAKDIDSLSNIRLIPGQLKGVQQFLKERLEKRIRFLAKSYVKFRTSQCIKLKLTGDGTSISCILHLVVIAFTLVESQVASQKETIP